MDLAHMQKLYDLGRLSDVMAVAENQDDSWHLDCHDLWGHVLHLTDNRGEPRRFHSLDSASRVARDIGFSEIQVVEH
ncbi:hypothetical protein HBA55_31960 [Pseudomaricurvus alkylphenolicus]|jgi:hypothetical protein|uniref:hypothetical protein n=1 Tax=Pseudomaricurvus alkylphenolicus TaxID=1306991 RepID=UPI00141F2B37|nr:hypothetical protein [Pseudomaricurvus alkylphenolicus]NIB44259.1 hypothetical protein [Pseudomaricurvus alkylphenolicus]